MMLAATAPTTHIPGLVAAVAQTCGWTSAGWACDVSSCGAAHLGVQLRQRMRRWLQLLQGVPAVLLQAARVGRLATKGPARRNKTEGLRAVRTMLKNAAAGR